MRMQVQLKCLVCKKTEDTTYSISNFRWGTVGVSRTYVTHLIPGWTKLNCDGPDLCDDCAEDRKKE